MQVIRIDRTVLLQALTKAQIALGSTNVSDQTVYFSIKVSKSWMTIRASDLGFCSIVKVPLNAPQEEDAEFTIHGHQFVQLVASLDEGVVELVPNPADLCVKVVRGRSDMVVRSFDASAYQDIYKQYEEVKEAGEKVNSAALIEALNYVSTFVAASEAHPELNMIEIENGFARATSSLILGSYEATAFANWKKVSVHRAQINKVLSALKVMGSVVEVAVAPNLNIVSGDNFKLFFPKQELSLPNMSEVFALAPEAFIKLDKVHLQVILRRFGILIEGQDVLMNCSFLHEEGKRYLAISVDINGRVSKDMLEVIISGNMDLLPFKFSPSMVQKVLTAIPAPVVELSFFPKNNLICMKSVTDEAKTSSFLSTISEVVTEKQ